MTEVLRVEGVTREFSPAAGVFDLDLEVGRGEIHALVGLNGSGKTTLMRLLLGMLRPESGAIRIAGIPVPRVRVGWARVGHLVEQPVAYPELDTRTNLSIAARLKGLSGTRLGEAVAASAGEFELEEYLEIPARRLSQGNRQRLGLAAALAHDPRLIVLDEPTNTLDPAGVILLRNSLRRRADAGAAILVSSHHLDEVARIADKISLLNYGRLLGELDPDEPDLERRFFNAVHADDLRTDLCNGARS